MNPAIRVVDRLRPVIVVGAIGLHAIAVAAVPDYVQKVSQLFDEAQFVEVEPVVPEAAAPPPPPVERVAVRAPREVVRETPRAENVPPEPPAETPPPAPTSPAPVAENAPEAAPSDPLTGAGGSVNIATTGNVGSVSGNGTSTHASTVREAAPAFDRRAMMRDYRATVGRAIGPIPRLRGTRDQIDAAVVVGMRIGADGRVSDVRVVRTSGHPVVDAHVVDFFRGRRLPTPPAELGLGATEFTYLVRVET